MTAADIINTAKMLSYTTHTNKLTPLKEDTENLELLAVNRALADFGINAVTTLESDIALSCKVADAVCYGAARVLAAAYRNTYRLNELTDIYNSKRASALSGIVSRIDSIPY